MRRTSNFEQSNSRRKGKLKDESKNSEGRKVNTYFYPLEMSNDLTKNRQKEIVEEKIKQREELYKVQAAKLQSIKNT